MNNVRKVVWVLLLLLCNCGTHPKSFNHTGIKSDTKFELSNYEIYQFSMSRKKIIHGQTIKNVEFYETPDGEDQGGVVHEMLYILRDTLSKSIIYFTTFSHKYLHSDSGVFNDPSYKEHVFVNDVDHIFMGREIDNKFQFYNPRGRAYAQNIQFYFTEKNDVISIDSVTNNYAKLKSRIEKPFVKIEDDVFGIPINFKKQGGKKIVWLKNKKGESNNREGKPYDVTHMWFGEKKLYFSYIRGCENHQIFYGGNKLRYIEPQ